MQRSLEVARVSGWKRIAALAGVACAVLVTQAPAIASEEVAAQPASPSPSLTTEVVMRAMSFLGVHYKLGGNSPETGLDCSGLVRNVFRDVVGLVLPRRAVEMSHQGEAIADSAQLKPGDLVFFRTVRKAVSHVGIYIGNHQFVHAPSRNGSVRVDSIDEKYWNRRFVSARRVPLPKAEQGSPYVKVTGPSATLTGRPELSLPRNSKYESAPDPAGLDVNPY